MHTPKTLQAFRKRKKPRALSTRKLRALRQEKCALIDKKTARFSTGKPRALSTRKLRAFRQEKCVPLGKKTARVSTEKVRAYWQENCALFDRKKKSALSTQEYALFLSLQARACRALQRNHSITTASCVTLCNDSA